MSAANLRQACYLLWFCRPSSDRQLFRAIKRQAPVRIVEFGVGDGTRAKRMLQLAQRFQSAPIQYAGIDLFEADESRPYLRISLKQAYRDLLQLGVRPRLIPGDLVSAVTRSANALGDTDLLVVDGMHADADLAGIWYFVPRMLSPQALVARYTAKNSLEFLSKADVERLAGSAPRRAA